MRQSENLFSQLVAGNQSKSIFLARHLIYSMEEMKCVERPAKVTTEVIIVVLWKDVNRYFGVGWQYLQNNSLLWRCPLCVSYVVVVISSEVAPLTSSLLSTSNQREMPGRLWTRVSVVLSTHRLCVNTQHLRVSAVCWSHFKKNKQIHSYLCPMHTRALYLRQTSRNVIMYSEFQGNM